VLPVTEHLFVVGTEEGRIHKCSKDYNSHLQTYEVTQIINVNVNANHNLQSYQLPESISPSPSALRETSAKNNLFIMNQ
jgi:acetone carboxylase gamma subunit